MFTGIVEKTGRVIAQTEAGVAHASGGTATGEMFKLVVDGGPDFVTAHGDSVAINGCCLTVTHEHPHYLTFDVSGETLRKTTLGTLTAGSLVNLERALRAGDRLGGHLVTGHIDGTGQVEALQPWQDGWELQVSVPQELGRYFVPKGSVALDGVSLTVNQVDDQDQRCHITMCLIPTTLAKTTLGGLKPGHRLNVEVDPIGKYVERLLGGYVR